MEKKTTHQSIGQRVNELKTAEEKKQTIKKWVQKWYVEQTDLVRNLGIAVAEDNYDQLCITTGHLKAVTTRKFEVLLRLIESFGDSAIDNNTVFNSLLILTHLSKDQDLTQAIFKMGGLEVSRSQIKAWRTQRTSKRSSAMPDEAFSAFISGLFEYRYDQAEEAGRNIFNFPIEQQTKL